MPAIIVRICWPCLFVGLLLVSLSATALAADGLSWEAVGTFTGGALIAGVSWYLLFLKSKADAAMTKASAAHDALAALRLHLVENHPTFDDVTDTVGTSIRIALAENLPDALDAALSRRTPLAQSRALAQHGDDR